MPSSQSTIGHGYVSMPILGWLWHALGDQVVLCFSIMGFRVSGCVVLFIRAVSSPRV